MIYKLNGVVIDINQEHRIGDINYPRYSLPLRREEWTAMGITEEPDPIPVPEDPVVVLRQQKLQQIAELEMSITNRMLREAVLGATIINPITGKTAMETILQIEQEIALLRASL